MNNFQMRLLWSSEKYILPFLLVNIFFLRLQCQAVTCPEEYFQCDQHQCIPKIWMCDGEKDCQDESDEAHCSAVTSGNPVSSSCSREEFRCKKSGLCIPIAWRCNSHVDCDDESDELRCIYSPVLKSVENCDSADGYSCSQLCVSKSDDSHTCKCEEGYELKNDTTCIATGDEPILIFSTNQTIKAYSIRSKVTTVIQKNVTHSLGVTLNRSNGCVYWVDSTPRKKTIFSSQMDGSDKTTAISSGINHPEFLAIDWLVGNLYFTDYGARTIVACSLHQDLCHVVINKGLNSPRGIALDVAEGLMFWTDWGQSPHIGKAGMDGNYRTLLVTKTLGWPNAVTLDTIRKRVYWADAKLKRIDSIGYDGQNRKLILQRGIKHPFAMVLFEDKLYWSDWGQQSIEVCDKKTGRNHVTLLNTTTRPMGLEVYHPLLQKSDFRNPCSDASCSHQCLLSPDEGHSCVCPTGFHLGEDKKICQEMENEPFIYFVHDNKLSKFHPDAVGKNIIIDIPLKSNFERATAIAYNQRSKTLYYSEHGKTSIVSMDMKTMIRTIVATEIGVVRDMTFDSTAENLYWVDSGYEKVEVMSVGNQQRTVLMSSESTPLALTIVMKFGIMFIAQGGKRPLIMRMNMDGKEQSVLFDSLPWAVPTSLTTDIKNQRLFWCDSLTDKIRYSSFDGKFQKILSITSGNPISLLLYGTKLYWSDRNSSDIHWMTTKVGDNIHDIKISPDITVNSEISSSVLMTITSSHDDIREANPCAKNQCSNLCLLNPSNYTCACPIGLVLDSDRKTCIEFKSCSVEHFQCKSKTQCILLSRRCNGQIECDDGSDEFNCTSIRCTTQSCRECQGPTKNPSCPCDIGYQKNDDQQCEDIDECYSADDNTCSHNCVNTPGSYACACEEGYTLKYGGGCIAEGDEPILIFSTNNSVRSYKLHSKEYGAILENLNNLEGVAYDGSRKLVYWSSVYKEKIVILSSRLDGSAGTVFIETGVKLARTLAIDWLGDNLYFTDSYMKHIAACSLENEVCNVVLNKGLDKPRGLALDPSNGWMYWTDWGNPPYIGKGGMDGSKTTHLVTTMLGWPNNLAIDYIQKRLYWVDAKLDRVESISLDGKNRKLLFEKTLHPFAIAMFEDKVYWSDWKYQSIESINKKTGHNHERLIQEKDVTPNGMQIYHPLLQQVTRNPCSKSSCSHQCILAPNGGHSCVCPIGYRLGKGLQICEENPYATSILFTHGKVMGKFFPTAIGTRSSAITPITPSSITIGEISSVEHNWKTGVTYAADVMKKRIIGINMKTLEMTIVAAANIDNITDMAFDWTANNLYWVDAGLDTIEVLSLSNNHRTTIMKTGKSPVAIILVMREGFMLVAHSGSGTSPCIEQMDMDGRRRSVVFNFPPFAYPTSLAVDTKAEGLFIADTRGTILYSTFDGKKGAFIKKTFGKPISLLPFGSKIYWTDQVSHELYSAEVEGEHVLNNNTDKSCGCDLSTGSRLALISNDPPRDDVRGYNPCLKNVNPCSHICLLTPKGYKCACPTGFVLGVDRKTCNAV